MQRHASIFFLSSIALVLLAAPALAVCVPGQPVLTLKVDGSDVEGEVTCLGEGENGIQVLGFGHSISRAWSAGGGATSQVAYEPITIIKPVDKATPQLLRALAQNETVEATIRFFGDPSAPGSATFVMELSGARIVGISSAAGDGDTEPTEAISIGWNTLRVEDTVHATEHEYTFGGGGA